MDGHSFDNITKAFATAKSRRQAIKAIAAGVAGGALSLIGVSKAAGRQCREIGDQCRSNAECCHRYCDSVSSTCLCPAGLTCNPSGQCREPGDNCRANADCCLGVCTTDTFQCACPSGVPGCSDSGQCREVGDNCSASAECCSGFCDSTFHCGTCPPATELCRGSCIPLCQTTNPCAISVCSALTGQCELLPANRGAVCRPAASECDLPEACTGATIECPSDQFTPTGTPCTSDDNPCTNDVCNGQGACTHPPLAAGVPCSSDNNECTADVCNATGQCTHPPLSNTPCGTGQTCCNGVCCAAGTGCVNGRCGCPSTTPNFCATSNTCLAACTVGSFDATTCTCTCAVGRVPCTNAGGQLVNCCPAGKFCKPNGSCGGQ